MIKILTLNLKAKYWDQIVAGTKTEEYREYKSHWIKRLEGREYDYIRLCKGYPKKTDLTRIIFRTWKGFSKKFIVHEQFGDKPMYVYAIDVSKLKKEIT
jgi:hypothetical protein